MLGNGGVGDAQIVETCTADRDLLQTARLARQTWKIRRRAADFPTNCGPDQAKDRLKPPATTQLLAEPGDSLNLAGRIGAREQSLQED